MIHSERAKLLLIHAQIFGLISRRLLLLYHQLLLSAEGMLFYLAMMVVLSLKLNQGLAKCTLSEQ